jgi:homoserine acetyltransferase
VESLAQESEDPEHGRLDDLLGRDPSADVLEAMVICPASACSFGAPPGSAIPCLAHVCTNTGTGGMAPNRF